MGMSLIREDVQTGEVKSIGTYDDITTHVGNTFTDNAAKAEAKAKGGKVDVSNVMLPDCTKVRHSAIVIVRGIAIANYYAEWSDAEDDTTPERQEFDYQTADDAVDPAVVIFNTEEDGSQKDELVVVPFNKDAFSHKPDPVLSAMAHAESIGEFVTDALNGFLKTEEGKERYQQLKDEVGWN